MRIVRKENYNEFTFQATIRSHCSECKSPSKKLIEIGEDYHSDSCTAFLCLNCLEKAVTIMKENE